MSEDQDRGSDPQDQTLTLDEVLEELELTRKALKKANAEAAERRIKLRDLEQEQEQRQQADMTEAQKLKVQLDKAERERDELSSTLTSQTIRSTVLAEAAKLGFSNPEDAYRLVMAEATVEIGADGSVSGHKKPLDELAKSGRLAMRDDNKQQLGTPPGQMLRRGSQGKPEGARPKIRM